MMTSHRTRLAVALLSLAAGCGGTSGPNSGSVSNAPDGTFSIKSVYADYNTTDDLAIIRFSTASDACAEELAGRNGESANRKLLELDFGRTGGGSSHGPSGTYVADPSNDNLLTDGVFYVNDASGGFGDQWNTTNDFRVVISSTTTESLRGTFAVTLQQVSDSDPNPPSQQVTGSFDAAYCQAVMLPSD